jgi:DNA polymerase III delta prime subunit
MFNIEMETAPEVYHHSIWAEKYRPKCFDDFVGNDTVKETFKLWLEKKDIPQIFLWGSPGSGKTSAAKILIKNIPCDSLFINASDENSVDVMRNKVQDFAMTIGCNPLKIIVLDEFDRVSIEAQSLLRNLCETYSQSTRFILTANYHEKVIPAIKSRFQSFELKIPSMSAAMSYLVKILDSEHIIYTKEDAAFVIKSYYPDLRKIINFAQQSSINGELKIAKANTADQDYKTRLIEMLKTPGKANQFNDIRQLVANASFSEYESVYLYLFDNVNEYADSTKAPLVILNLAEAVYQSALVFEREITFVAAMHKLLVVLNGK